VAPSTEGSRTPEYGTARFCASAANAKRKTAGAVVFSRISEFLTPFARTPRPAGCCRPWEAKLQLSSETSGLTQQDQLRGDGAGVSGEMRENEERPDCSRTAIFDAREPIRL
jgi:hypothetical protein